jgi:glutathione synthase/RimK-type ligase-like ATP-grasp enzyme
MTDITILTCKEFFQPEKRTSHIDEILLERKLLQEALEKRGLKVSCTYWDDPTYDWSQTKAIVVRTIWDYYERYDEFSTWIDTVKDKTQLINPKSLIDWNIDKHYLADLEAKGIAIVPTAYVDTGAYRSMEEVCEEKGWTDVVMKPAIAGSAFHTHKVMHLERASFETLFKELVGDRDMLIQPFQETITNLGEASLMVFNGKYTHAILKKAKAGDYRVQSNFGGTVSDYTPTPEEVAFAEHVFNVCDPMPAYGRADIIWDTDGTILLGELEIIEPELWVRNHPIAAEDFADGILQYFNESCPTKT